jgi:hypothetical protein
MNREKQDTETNLNPKFKSVMGFLRVASEVPTILWKQNIIMMRRMTRKRLGLNKCFSCFVISKSKIKLQPLQMSEEKSKLANA